MKQFKFLSMALILLMGVSFASCLDDDDDDDSVYDWAGFVYVRSTYGSVYFVDSTGNIISPTSTSVSELETSYGIDISSYKFAYVYTKDLSSTTTSTSSNTYYVSLVAIELCSYGDATVAETEEELATVAPETAPIISFYYEDSYYQYSYQYSSSIYPALFDESTLVVPIYWWMGSTSSLISQHTFVLACVTEEIEANDTELVFYLHHDVGTDEAVSNYSYTCYGFNIDDAVETFENITGRVPSKLTVKSHQTGWDSTEMTMDDYSSSSVTYTTD